MKYLIKLCLVLFCIVVAINVCAAPKHTAQRGCALISEDGGYISLRVIEYGAKTELAVANAKKLAMETILFRGVEKSKLVAKPLVGTNEDTIKDTHKEYFRDFFEKQRCETFVVSSFIVTPLSKDISKQKFIVIDIKISINTLKSDLETNKIIRRFGF